MEKPIEELDIHCLRCDHTYPEEKQMVKICPKCGNADMLQTVYLCTEDE